MFPKCRIVCTIMQHISKTHYLNLKSENCFLNFPKTFLLSGHNLVSAAMFPHLSQPLQHPHGITIVLFLSLIP